MWNARKIKTPEPFPVLAFFSEDSLHSFLTVEKKSPETTQNSVSRLVMRDAPLFLIATSKLVPFDVALVRFFPNPATVMVSSCGDKTAQTDAARRLEG